MGKTAKKVKAHVEDLKSWDEVDRALRQIGECEIAVEQLEAEMNREINEAKAKAEKMGKTLMTTVAVLEAQIKAFVEDKKDELDGKSRYLNYGVVGFRQSTSISYSTKKTEEIIEKLKKYGMANCINVKESVNKEALKLYSDKDIQKVGAVRKVEDNFYCDADREKIRG